MTSSPDPAQELADLRRGWGEAYRITCGDGRFRATHIITAEAIDAANAASLRKLLRDHYSRLAVSIGFSPGDGGPTTTAITGQRRI